MDKERREEIDHMLGKDKEMIIKILGLAHKHCPPALTETFVAKKLDIHPLEAARLLCKAERAGLMEWRDE